MQIDQSKIGEVTVITLNGDLDSNSGGNLKERFGKLFNEGVYEIVVDLRQVPFMDSAGLGHLVNALKMCVHHKGNLMLVGANESIVDLLRITRLDTIFRVYDSPEEAAVAFLP